MKNLLLGLWIAAISCLANAQSTPGFSYGQVPTPGQWNSYFANKMDYLLPGSSGNVIQSDGISWRSTPFTSAGSIICAQLPALIGDVTTMAGNCATTVSKIDGFAVAFSGPLTTTGTGSVTFGFPNTTIAYTFPATTATLARTDAAQTFTGVQSFGSGATGLSIESFTGGGYAAIYNTNVTAGNTNYTLDSNGINTNLNGTTSANLAVAGSAIVAATSTGAAIAGTASVSGNTTLSGLLTSGSIANALCTDSSGHVIANSGANCYSGGGGVVANYVVETTTYNASANDYILADTTSAAFTITLPGSPAQFARICFIDAAGTFNSNTLTINPNSLKIMGSTSNMTVITQYANFCLIYYTSGTGWRMGN